MLFTEDEKTVILYFFTTLDTQIACATDNMPSSLWAYLVGSYSRSHEPIRRRLLISLFLDSGLTASEFASAIRDSNSAYLSHALGKAESFLRKWAVEYGHNSLKDSSNDRFAIEGCSILAAKAFEDSELGAYQEKSTRYLPFSVESVNDLSVPFEYFDAPGVMNSKYKYVFTQVFTAYDAVLAYWADRHYAESDPAQFVNDAARRRTTRAQAFDKARYYLPVCVKTSFGATIPTRETARLISRLLAHPLSEVRCLAQLLLLEVTKVNPGLFTHVEPDTAFDGFDPIESSECLWPEPLRASLGQVEELENSIVLTSKCSSVGATVQVTLPKDLRQRTAASFVAFYAKRFVPSSFRPISGITASLSTNLIQLHCGADDPELDSILAAAENHYKSVRTDYHKDVPRYLDHIHVTLDVLMDYGAYRDLQRHRAGKQDIASFLDSVGVIEFPGFDQMPIALQALCRNAVQTLTELRSESASAVYLKLLGHPVIWTYTCSLRQLVYLTELRSQPSGHISYRTIACEVANMVSKFLPWLFPFVDKSGDATRAVAENRIQTKISNILH